MNIVSRVCMVALLAAWLPLAIAQEEPPPADTEPAQREEMQKDVDEAVDAIRGYSLERRKEALARAQTAVADADRRVTGLQAQVNERWDRMSVATRTRSQQVMADLRQRRNTVAEWAGGMRHSSGDAWTEVKAGFVASYRDLAESLRKARMQFERDQAQDTKPDDKTSAEKPQEH